MYAESHTRCPLFHCSTGVYITTNVGILVQFVCATTAIVLGPRRYEVVNLNKQQRNSGRKGDTSLVLSGLWIAFYHRDTRHESVPDSYCRTFAVLPPPRRIRFFHPSHPRCPYLAVAAF